MNKIVKIRFWLILSLTGFFVSAGYELREAGHSFGGVPSYVIAMLSLLIGAKLAEVVVDYLLRLRWIRRELAASTYVEGYWYLETANLGDSPLNKDGILYIHNDPSTDETKAVTTRLNEDGDEFPTKSEIAYVQWDADLKYLNYFRLTYPGPQPKFGLASGRFIRCDDLKSYPTFLEAHIVLTGEDVVRRQSAVKIDDEVVKNLQSKFGSKWKTEALKAGKEVLIAAATAAKNGGRSCINTSEPNRVAGGFSPPAPTAPRMRVRTGRVLRD